MVDSTRVRVVLRTQLTSPNQSLLLKRSGCGLNKLNLSDLTSYGGMATWFWPFMEEIKA